MQAIRSKGALQILDPFHIAKNLNKAIDTIRGEETCIARSRLATVFEPKTLAGRSLSSTWKITRTGVYPQILLKSRQTSEEFCPYFEEFLSCSPQDHLLWLVKAVAMDGNIMMIRALFVFGVMLLCGGQIVRAEQPPTPDQAIAADGKRVSMRGVVSEVVRRDSGYIYVNVGGKHPDHEFAVWIHKMDVDEFPKVDTWTGRKMTFSGVVEIFKGKPMIRIRKPEDSAVAE